MISHQPEVSRLLHQEHVQRLAADAQRPLHDAHPASPRRKTAETPLGLSLLTAPALDVQDWRL